MNKTDRENSVQKGAVKRYLHDKWKDLFLIGVLAIVLLFAVSQVFKKEEKTGVVSSMTETEKKVGRLLQEIQGVGDAEVIVCEEEDGATRVVIVCDGAKDIRVVMDVREAVAAALGTEEKSIKIYQKK